MDEQISFDERLLPADSLYRPRRNAPQVPRRVLALLVISAPLVYSLAVTYLEHTAPENIEINVQRYALFTTIAVVFAEILIWALVRARRMQSLFLEVNDTAAMVSSGRLAEAEHALDDLCARSKPYPQVHAMAVHNRGVVFLRRGERRQALGLFGAALISGCFEKERQMLYPLYPLLLGNLALCYAIEGDLDSAERWQTRAHEHLVASRTGMLLNVDTYIGVRRERYEVMLKDADQLWFTAEGLLPASSMRGLRLLCAFAHSCLNADGSRTEKIRSLLEGARPSPPGEFDHFAAKWSEFEVFLVKNGFSKPAEVLVGQPPPAQVKR